MTIKKEELLKAKEQMKKIAMQGNREELIAQVINDTYDPEFPIPEIIESLFNVSRVNPFESVYYFTPTLPTKEVYLLTSSCDVTHQAVSPASKSTLSWTTAVTKDYYICLDDLLAGDTDVVALYAEDVIEALNRYEIYAVLQLIDAGAVARSNAFTLDSGKTKFDLPKLVEMKKAIRKYGKKLVLISGANVTEDIELMDYDADKNREVSISSIVDAHIPIESLDVNVGGSTKDVISDDIAYLVAVSDAKKNKPGYFARRKISSQIGSFADTQIVDKERAIISTGTIKPVDTVDKFAKGIAGLEQFGAVLTNSYTCAKFTRS